MPDFFAANLDVLQRRYPVLAARLENFPELAAVCVFKARDGGVAYGLRQGGKILPLTDPIAPLARLQQQINHYAAQLQDFTRPVLIVGLYPGSELLGIFKHAEEYALPHCPQPIWVCLDSLPCFYGFLKAWDARQLLAAERVHWFTREEMPERVAWLKAHPEFPHVFTLISGAPERVLDEIMPPLAVLVEERCREMERLKKENDAYYNSLDDQQLAEIIAGAGQAGAARPPRIMVPTCAWSTYIQHSARDLCAAFEQLGWQTRLLRMEAMLTPYYLVQQINEFKPDVFLFIDHLRSEAEEIYPRQMMFVTWVQDEMQQIFSKAAGQKFAEYAARGRRDLIIGYVDQLRTKFDFPPERLLPLLIPANPAIFHKIELTDAQRRQYGCELAFMCNTGFSSEKIMQEEIIPVATSFGLSSQTVIDIHAQLWSEYRAGKIYADRALFLGFLLTFNEFKMVWERFEGAANDMPQRELMRLFYWRMNDIIYRQVVLEWADELGVQMHLYGHGWEQHPRFRKYARGVLKHGEELNAAYQAARFNLHLNITQGMHQRIWEILSCGAGLLVRTVPRPPKTLDPPAGLMRRLAPSLLAGDRKTAYAALEAAMAVPNEGPLLQDWIFKLAWADAQREKQEDSSDTLQFADKVLNKITAYTLSRPDWLIANWEEVCFTDRAGFAEKIGRHLSP